MRATILGVAALAATFGMVSAANAQPVPQPLKIHPLKDGVYWTEGGVGSNTAIIVGDNGVTLIDGKMTVPTVQELRAEIAKITPKPITHIILTHSDRDHVNGLPGYDKSVTVVAQENCKKEMEAAIAADPQLAALRDYLPKQTIGANETVTYNGVRMQLLNTGPAHTSGDLIIYLPAQKIAFAGDLLAPIMPFPYVHLEKQGTVIGWMKAAEAMLALDTDTYVSGHGAMVTKAQLRDRLNATRTRVDQIRAMIAQGKSLDEIKTTLGEEPRMPGLPPNFEGFNTTTYKELTAKS